MYKIELKSGEIGVDANESLYLSRIPEPSSKGYDSLCGECGDSPAARVITPKASLWLTQKSNSSESSEMLTGKRMQTEKIVRI